MIEPIFDRNGEPVGWLFDYLVHDSQQNNVGHVQSGYFFAPNGDHLGQFLDGYFWDLQGCAVGFVADASGLPELPATHPLVPKVPHNDAALPKLPSLPAYPLIRLDAWSSVSWVDYLGMTSA